ncbi:hypothetical protein BKA65DRAFT_575854 [Rhexocercosporidium sp. MPI-PUGE-AT-0058]|nr:hypothetical protein BKA65DRAFT_575854 [Rhexocercosporidium sp. MPI-PUGE-AT-0058]
MQLLNLILVAATAILSVDACKCVNPNGGANNVGTTAFCCGQNQGTFITDDCRANSISNRLSNFKNCCRGSGLNSDCSCPTCRDDAGIEAVTNITTRLGVGFLSNHVFLSCSTTLVIGESPFDL